MSLITFDITYNKKTEINALKLSVDAEYQQLKFMICGKYKLYDLSKVDIVYKNKLLTPKDNTKLKDIFDIRKIKLEVVTDYNAKRSLSKTNGNIQYGYYCLCKKEAQYICDKCDEYICDFCYKKKKHITHLNNIIKLKDYSMFIKDTLKGVAAELDAKIVNDETYQFFTYWKYDLNNEITNINSIYEYLKKELEDIKQMQIDYLITISSFCQYNSIKEDIEDIVKQFASVSFGDDYDKMRNEKNNIKNKCNDVLNKYADIKTELFHYTTVIKDIEMFNTKIANEIKDKFIYIKKKYLISRDSFEISPMNMLFSTQTSNSNNPFKNVNTNMNCTLTSLNNDLQQDMKHINNNNSFLDMQAPNMNHNNCNSNYNSTWNVTKTQNMSTIQNSSFIGDTNKLYFNLKDDKTILIFNTITQTFKEKIYNDVCRFKDNLPSEYDVIQINLNGKLYILSGQQYNQFYYYDYQTNSINFINDTLHTHYYGSFVYCQKNNSLYLIGGNNQLQNEIYYFDNNPKCEWEALPPLNEERQEFASICVGDCIYVFFGFSPMTGKNLSSIECINVDKNDQFEIIYVNENITLSALACTVLREDNEEEEIDYVGEILLLGGFDGQDFINSSLIFNIKETKIRDSDIQIPDFNKHNQFLFQRENAFLQLENGIQILSDMNNNIHLISGDSYELFWESK